MTSVICPVCPTIRYVLTDRDSDGYRNTLPRFSDQHSESRDLIIEINHLMLISDWTPRSFYAILAQDKTAKRR
jgi:hypothetical protein